MTGHLNHKDSRMLRESRNETNTHRQDQARIRQDQDTAEQLFVRTLVQ
jgi:hypothetical protein